MSHLIGVTLRNRYKIFQCLGGGGFGDTYLARDLDLPGQPQCVIKHLKPKDSSPAVLAISQRLDAKRIAPCAVSDSVKLDLFPNSLRV